MKRFLKTNIDNRGRLVRGLGGAGLVGGALLAYHISPWLALAVGLGGLFMLFEAARGWCALRACGLKTRI
jgi:hypothetical protein